MMTQPRYWIVIAALCTACGGDGDTVARLIEHHGEVSKDRGNLDWARARDGDRFRCQHGVSTGSGSWARLALRAGSRVQLKEDTLVRFACAGAAQGFRVELGESEIEAPDHGGELILDIGSVTMSPSGRYRVRADGGRTRFEVIVGTAIVRRGDASPEELSARQSLELELGESTVRQVATDAALDAGASLDAGAHAGQRDADDERDHDAAAPAEVAVSVTGRRNQRRPPDAERWEPLPAGEHALAPGTGLRLGAGGQAAITRGAERAEVSGPGEVIVGEPGGDLIEARRGSAQILAVDAPVRIRVPGGVIVARRVPGGGSRASIDVSSSRTRVRPESGVVEVSSDRGQAQALTLGESAVLGRDGRIQTLGRAPAYADMIMTAGESVTIHDPRPPTAVAIRFSDLCDDAAHGGEGVVEVARSPAFRGDVTMSKGTHEARVLLKPRAYHYRVRCLLGGVPEPEARASGRIRIQRNDGTRQLPAQAPQSVVDADGRRYTVLYQNHLPEIVFRWQQGRATGPLELHVVPSRGRPTVYAAAQPRHVMPAGALSEGTYEFFFQQGETRSSTSTLRIEFDNAAPSAYLRSPGVKERWSGDSLRVAGAALRGWSVTVDGASLPLDAQGRFAADVSRPARARALAVRIAHTRHGVHYYLRRDAAGP